VVGKDVILDEYFLEGRNDRLPQILAEVLSRKPAVIVASRSQAVHAAKAATSNVPIVIASAADPVGQGIVASLAHPGGNLAFWEQRA
jgi:putative ABC transport system substrate-binding protein